MYNIGKKRFVTIGNQRSERKEQTLNKREIRECRQEPKALNKLLRRATGNYCESIDDRWYQIRAIKTTKSKATEAERRALQDLSRTYSNLPRSSYEKKGQEHFTVQRKKLMSIYMKHTLTRWKRSNYKMCQTLFRKLWELFRVIWRKETIPACWREADMARQIHKSGLIVVSPSIN